MATTVLRGPVTVWRMPEGMAGVVQDWVRVSLRPIGAEEFDVPDGTVLLRTGGTWDSLLGFVDRSGTVLSPLVVFKNPVPLWQSSLALSGGVIKPGGWSRLRRVVMLHNPGLDGFLRLVDPVVADHGLLNS